MLKVGDKVIYRCHNRPTEIQEVSEVRKNGKVILCDGDKYTWDGDEFRNGFATIELATKKDIAKINDSDERDDLLSEIESFNITKIYDAPTRILREIVNAYKKGCVYYKPHPLDDI